MAEELTMQQKAAVFNRGGKLLVSAAAGSGKTKVLVERLLDYLTDSNDPANIDDFLIITYTKAAASELRGKIASKLLKKLAEEPTNRHLQQQMQRLYLAKISTVHSFCSDILREYTYRTDIPADFRVAEENECVELQTRVIQQILDDRYENASQDSDFCALIDSQGFGRDDRQIPEIILKVYHSAMCHLNPDEWLDKCLAYDGDQSITDAAQTDWGRYLLEDLRNFLSLQIDAMQKCVDSAIGSDGMEKPVEVLNSTIDQLVALKNCTTWDAVQLNMQVDFGRLTFTKKCTDLDLVEQIKTIRNTCKSGLQNKLKRFSGSSKQVLYDMSESMKAVRGLISLVRQFADGYSKLKRSKHILDFSDLEHKTLDLLTGKSRSTPTKIAQEIGQRFREIMVDEYQDSNAVQDAVFSALTSERQNCFMVGDVKQSIYQFRLADPGIFLKKYNDFVSYKNAEIGQERKVLLSKNFRSSGGVITAVNNVFSACMSPEVGGLYYNEEEFLVEGLPHVPLNEPEVAFFAIKTTEDKYAEEADFVANKIAEMLDGKHMVRDGDNLRPITPDDIVILLRSPGSVGAQFQFALEQKGVNCTTGGSADILATEEIETLCALLQTINNPLQDIPLVATMASRIFGFTADELALIRSRDKECSFYAAVQKDHAKKTKNFLDTLNTLREASQLYSLSDFLGRVFTLTRIDSVFSAMEDGDTRTENLQIFCNMATAYASSGNGSLSKFLEHLKTIVDRGISTSNDKTVNNAVSIMSIHKSKGLEFPVVFLCCLSREFNKESVRAQVLCHKDLGLGLTCVDTANRVRYPSLAKRAIAAKINAESISEEMRVLYVAMTRAKDRLIMTYAGKKIEDEIADIQARMQLSAPLLMTQDVYSPGEWILYAAMHQNVKWPIQIVSADCTAFDVQQEELCNSSNEGEAIGKIKNMLDFTYQHQFATTIPSKQTATQLKGRYKDQESAENTQPAQTDYRIWRSASFANKSISGKEYGTAIHTVMQHINFSFCTDADGVKAELVRMVEKGYITKEQSVAISVDEIASFFTTDVGTKLIRGAEALREFKFSILTDASAYYENIADEKILLQGVVDCALIEDDGITVIDFKSDRVTQENLEEALERYKPQVAAYANAIQRIYQKPIKAAKLYFFAINQMVDVI